MGVSKRYILAAAIWYKELPRSIHSAVNVEEGVVVCGWRHPNIISTVMALSGKRTVTFGERAAGQHVQGFLTSDGHFVDREEAAEIAYNAGQTEQKLKRLFSEDLY